MLEPTNDADEGAPDSGNNALNGAMERALKRPDAGAEYQCDGADWGNWGDWDNGHVDG